MPWVTPSLRQVRIMVRDDITAALRGAALIGNSVLRVIADVNAGLSHLVLRYIDWLARQLLPDSAEEEWLDRHGNIWLTNSDGSKGRKAPVFAQGTVTLTGDNGTVIPPFISMSYGDASFQTTEQVTLGLTPVSVAAIALTEGIIGNVDNGQTMTITNAPVGLDSSATVVLMDGGVDRESNDELRMRVLQRIQNPPMGGDKADYERWALACPGVTRAWAYPLEMGIGTITVRFLMDNLRASNHGIPGQADVQMVSDYIDTVRPVAVKDFFVVAPIPRFYDVTIMSLSDDTQETRATIEAAIKDMEKVRLYPGQTLYRSWVDEAISGAIGEEHHELVFATIPMEWPGYMGVLGTIVYG